MFKIGEFSKLSQVPVKTLRYYDQIGLFPPARVDRFTGYRYYSANQLPRLNRILALKDLGLSLDQVRLLLEDDLTPEQIRGMLRLKQSEIEEQLQEEQTRLARVEWRLKRIEQEEAMSTFEVVVKAIPATTVATVRDTVAAYSHLGQLLGEVYAHLGQHGVAPAGPPIGIYHDPEYREKDVDVQAAVPVSRPVPDGARVRAGTLPEVKEMACVIHEGDFETIGATYSQLMSWIEANGYTIAGPCREAYVQWAQPGEDPSTNLTELQFPVCK